MNNAHDKIQREKREKTSTTDLIPYHSVYGG